MGELHVDCSGKENREPVYVDMILGNKTDEEYLEMRVRENGAYIVYLVYLVV